ncbi:hypothetical protein D5W64_12820 [Salmonella enterica subsp. enterica serovar Saintpaul]|nr:hypothetical protein [Salmonella enterica subsp. enterica serovar Saintpaul]
MKYVNKTLIPVVTEENKSAFIDEKIFHPWEAQVTNSPFYFGRKATNFLTSGCIRNFAKFCLGASHCKTIETDGSTLKLRSVLVEDKVVGSDIVDYFEIEVDIPFTKGLHDYYILQRVEAPVGMSFITSNSAGERINAGITSIDLNLSFDHRGDILTLRQSKGTQVKVIGFNITADWQDNNISYTN